MYGEADRMNGEIPVKKPDKPAKNTENDAAPTMLRRRLVTAALSGPVVMAAPNLARAAGNSGFDTAQCLQEINNTPPDPFSDANDAFNYVRKTRTLLTVAFKTDAITTVLERDLFQVGSEFFETVSPNAVVSVNLASAGAGGFDEIVNTQQVQALVVVDSSGTAQGVGQLGGGFPLTNSCLGSIA